jgi:hypothetical protein
MLTCEQYRRIKHLSSRADSTYLYLCNLAGLVGSRTGGPGDGIRASADVMLITHASTVYTGLLGSYTSTSACAMKRMLGRCLNT